MKQNLRSNPGIATPEPGVRPLRIPVRPVLLLLSMGVIAALGLAFWESDWMLERQSSRASAQQIESLARRMPGSAIVSFHYSRSLAAQGKNTQAIDLLSAINSRTPSDARIAALLGDLLTREARFHEAGAVLEDAARRHPQDAEVQYALGVYYFRVFAHTQATAALQETVRLSPSHVRAWRVLAEAFVALGKYHEAIEAFAHALAIEPNDADTLARRANAHTLASAPELAEADMRAALKIAPDRVAVRVALGETLSRSRHDKASLAEAETLLRGVQADHPEFPETHRILGMVLNASQRWEEATRELNTYTRLRPNDPEGLFLYATALRGAGQPFRNVLRRHQDALNAVQKRTTLLLRVQGNPRDLRARLQLARFLASHNETALAILQYERILRQNPSSAEAQQALAVLRNAP